MKKGYVIVLALVGLVAVAAGAWAATTAPPQHPPYVAQRPWGTFQLNPKIAAKVQANQKINYVFSYQASGIALFSQQYALGYKSGCADGNKIYPMSCSS